MSLPSRLRGPVLLLPLLTGVVLAQPGDDRVFERYKALVERARGLEFKHPVKALVITPARYRRILKADSGANDDDDGPDGTEAAWKALGLIPRTLDLEKAEVGDEEDNTDGFYVSGNEMPPFKKGTLVIVRERGEDTTEVTVHELLHALHDQHFKLDKMSAEIPRTPAGSPVFDRENADGALEEGVSTLLGQEIAKRLKRPPNDDQAGPFEPESWVDAKAQFPYSAGRSFARAVRAKGGIKGLNAAYARPPTSSEQILHPERYLRSKRDLPSTVKIADMTRALPGTWKTIDTDTLGEFGIGWLTEPAAGAGWDGDQYQVIQDPKSGQTIANWHTTWDSPQDAAEFGLAAAKSDAVRAMKPGDLMVLRQRQRGVFLASGVKPHQLEALLKRGASSSVRKAKGDDDSWPDRKRPKAALSRLLQSAVSGTTLVRRGKTSRRSARVGTYVLSPRGKELAQKAMRDLAKRARKRRGRVKDLGDGRFALGPRRTVQFRDGILTYSAGPARAVRELSSVLAGLGRSPSPKPTPKAPQGSRRGAAQVLDGSFR